MQQQRHSANYVAFINPDEFLYSTRHRHLGFLHTALSEYAYLDIAGMRVDTVAFSPADSDTPDPGSLLLPRLQRYSREASASPPGSRGNVIVRSRYADLSTASTMYVLLCVTRPRVPPYP